MLSKLKFVKSIAILAIGMTTFLSQPSCTTKKAKETTIDKLSPAEREAINEYRAEVEIGRGMAGRLLQHYGTFGDEGVVGYVNQVGNYVASYGDFPDRRYMFAILDSESVNAFACPGGYILVTLGTLRQAKNEAELAAILGHESAHVGKQHMFNTLKKMRKKAIAAESAEVDKRGKGKTAPYQKVRARPKAENTALGSLVAKYLAGSAGAGMSLLQAAQAGMNLVMEKGLDEKLEYEADYEGVKYATRSGYEPKAMLYFLSRLEKQKKKLNTKVLEKTHPSLADRKKKIRALLKEMKASEIIGATGTKRYKAETLNKLPKAKKA